MKNRVQIIYTDEDMVAIFKPAHLLSIPDRYDKTKPNALDVLRKSHPEAMIVHRLDKETSGVLLFARNTDTHKYLNQLFEKGNIEKYYLTIVEGQVVPDQGEIDAALVPNPAKPGTMKIHQKGKSAKSSWVVKERFNDFTLVEVRIHTGRMHQVRVHMQSIQHPPVADPFYGKRSALYIYDLKQSVRKSNIDEPVPLIARTALHAHRIVLQQPKSGKKIEIQAEMPKDMLAVLNQLRKNNT